MADSENHDESRVMPRLTVVIGGNGSGKTTWTDVPENRAKLPKPFYNADTLAKGLGGYTVEAIFIGTDDPSINVDRVEA